MKKQGFTLIELMVVIVIMGILAAVAVPKLFGMIAKSKASEIGPAAGEYVKLQDAYVAENGTHVGNWKQIGYLMKSSSNFYYCGSDANACENEDATGYGGTSSTTYSNYVAYWTATSKATLNDCQAKSVWSLTTSQNGSSGGLVLYTAAVTGGDDGNCDVLTPNYKRLNTAAAASNP